jgi:hypothetical protein
MARDYQLPLRVSKTAIEIVEALQEYYGLSKASVIEMLLREEGRRKGILGPGGVVSAPVAHRSNDADDDESKAPKR